MRRRALFRIASGAALARPFAARAQAGWPNRPVRYINPFPAGGPTDTLAFVKQNEQRLAPIIRASGAKVD